MRQFPSLAAVLAVLIVLLPAVGRAGETLRVGSASELQQILKTPSSGLTIELAGGEYGILSLRNRDFGGDDAVVLRSADAGSPARFSGMTLRRVKNLVIEGVVFDYRFQTGDKLRLRPFDIANSQNIRIRDTLFDGDTARGLTAADNGFGAAFGLSVRDVSGLTLENSEIRDFYKGLVISQSRDVTVRNNDLHSMRMDGMNFAGVENVLIESNRIHDFARSPESKDHADMIQFWTKGTETPSVDVTIRGNLLNSGQGLYTQSIFVRNQEVDQGRAGAEMFYRNFTIEQNVIVNAHLHGITVGETDDLVIRANTVVRNARSLDPRKGMGRWTPMIRIAETARNVRILSNVVPKIVGHGGQRDWQVEDNFIVQNNGRGLAGFYGAVFAGDPADPAAFRYRRGGPLDGAGIGAARLQPR
ncbi:right-handed parallel beta-helix repeat-containing protein [Puniceibacterium sediminis]|uniref:Right handed beta helix region n=1 Tax=Puniceibacterium sediminis TaxID=1608407 RepID=A0A238YMG2_9RHOB|nr:right-handed parallel beta-helix repeat-containing protein [Puniceibacterium sediminis]SNR71978.1 Right handed beta helix region [Puniceibacterium sediminis]